MEKEDNEEGKASDAGLRLPQACKEEKRRRSTKGTVAFDDPVGKVGLHEFALALPPLDLPSKPVLVKVGWQLAEEVVERSEIWRLETCIRLDRLEQLLIALQVLFLIFRSLE